MVLFAIALRHGDITIQHTGRNSTQADTAHRQIQHTGRYRTQADIAHRQIQHTGRYSTQADIAHRQIQHTGRYSTQADTAHRQVQHSHTCTHIYALRFLSLTETLGANLSPTTSDASESS